MSADTTTAMAPAGLSAAQNNGHNAAFTAVNMEAGSATTEDAATESVTSDANTTMGTITADSATTASDAAVPDPLRNTGKKWDPDHVQALDVGREIGLTWDTICWDLGRSNVACRIKWHNVFGGAGTKVPDDDAEPQSAATKRAGKTSTRTAKKASTTSRVTKMPARSRGNAPASHRPVGEEAHRQAEALASDLPERSILASAPEPPQLAGFGGLEGYSWGSFTVAKANVPTPAQDDNVAAAPASVGWNPVNRDTITTTDAATAISPAELAAYDRGYAQGRRDAFESDDPHFTGGNELCAACAQQLPAKAEESTHRRRQASSSDYSALTGGHASHAQNASAKSKKSGDVPKKRTSSRVGFQKDFDLYFQEDHIFMRPEDGEEGSGQAAAPDQAPESAEESSVQATAPDQAPEGAEKSSFQAAALHQAPESAARSGPKGAVPHQAPESADASLIQGAIELMRLSRSMDAELDRPANQKRKRTQ